jgi:hypothetical protein
MMAAFDPRGNQSATNEAPCPHECSIKLLRKPPMSKIFYPTSEKLRYLLESIHNREVALPDFQRDFVWDPRATEELIESICQNFPAGSLLRIKNSDGAFFAPREVAEAPPLNGHLPSYLVLDGQQRLTSLYQAFYGVGQHRYFIHLGGMLAGQDLEDCVFYERQKRAQRKYGKIEQQAESLTFPFALLFGEGGGFEDWLDRVLEKRAEQGDERKELKKRIRDLRDRWIRPVEEYEFPMVSLSEETSSAAVCTIFETLNRTGVKLSVFDLLAARFWPVDVRLRDMWEQAQDDFPIISDFEVDPYYVLQAIALVTAKAPSCKRSDVLEMSVAQISAGWQPIIAGLANGLQMLHDDCGVIIPKWLPYNTIVVPLAAAFSVANHASGPEVAAARDKLKRWFWCSVFGQVYERAPNSQSAKDFGEIKRWLDSGDPPQSVQTFTFEPDSLRQTTPRQRAIYRGGMALILRHEARDFHSGKRITANMMLEEKIDDHHVFPQKYLSDSFPNISTVERDAVLNRTLIDKITNIHIGKRAPSDYLTEIGTALGAGKLEKLLRSHLIPSADDSPLVQDNFEEFLKQRQELIASQIDEVTR